MLTTILAQLGPVKLHVAAVLILQGAHFDLLKMWNDMLWPARSVAVALVLMSAWSIGIMMDRWLAFRAARKQSRQFAPMVAGALREGKLEEAIHMAERNKKSHLAKVVNAGLMEFRAHEKSEEISGDRIDASQRALDRATAIVH